MIKPVLQDEAFLADVAETAAAWHEQGDRTVHLWWLGQSGFLVHSQGAFLLIDPYLSDSLTRKYASTDRPHVRMSERVVDPVRLDFVDVVTSSHNHTDHLDAETLLPLIKARLSIEIVVPEANRQFAASRLGLSPEQLIGCDVGRVVTTRHFVLQGKPAAHPTVSPDDQGHHRFLGYVFVCGAISLYHSGDGVRYLGMEDDLLLGYQSDVAILPINGKFDNMNGIDAARLAKDIGAKLVIPCHYDMFEFNTATPDEFVAECERLGQRYRVLKLGERWSSVELDRSTSRGRKP
jgi:L-ascorbate metabolism protein UlaG (beta-lactamase superfamily)